MKVQIETRGSGKDYQETFSHPDPSVLFRAVKTRVRELKYRRVEYSLVEKPGSATFRFDATDKSEWG